MGLQNLLLGLGTALVAIALIVFTAVNWSRMDASTQGLVLVALTMIAAFGAAVAARRSQPATAEALGVVSILLALTDVHAFRLGFAPEGEAQAFWAAGLAIVSVLAWSLGRITGVRSPQIAGAVTAQFPLLLALGFLDAGVYASQVAVVAQAAVVLLLADRVTGVPRWSRIVGAGWAMATAGILTLAIVTYTFFEAVVDEIAAPGYRWCAVGLASAGLLALIGAWIRLESKPVRTSATTVATILGLAAAFVGSLEFAEVDMAAAGLAVISAVALLAFTRLPDAWGTGPAFASGLIAAGAALPLVDAIAVSLVAASNVPAEAWNVRPGRSAASFLAPGAEVVRPAVLVLDLVAVSVGSFALRRHLGQMGSVAGMAAIALSGLFLAPILLPISVMGVVLLGLVATASATGWAVLASGRLRQFQLAVVTTIVVFAWTAAWAAATAPLTLAVIASGTVCALAIGAVALRADEVEVGVGSALWVSVSVPLLAGMGGAYASQSVSTCWALAGAAAAGVSLFGALLLDPEGRASGIRRWMGQAVELASASVYALSLSVVATGGDPHAASVTLAVGVLAFGLHAARPHRRLAALVSAGLAVVLGWVQLDQAEVTVFEAYTLPVAALFLAIGLVVERQADRNGERLGSWVTLGPAVTVALVPTVWMALGDPGTVRPLAGLVAGALVLVAGVFSGRRALVDVGAATVVVLGVRQLAPIVAEIPNWAIIGLTGVLLLAVGATFEQRRNDVRSARRHYSSLR